MLPGARRHAAGTASRPPQSSRAPCMWAGATGGAAYQPRYLRMYLKMKSGRPRLRRTFTCGQNRGGASGAVHENRPTANAPSMEGCWGPTAEAHRYIARHRRPAATLPPLIAPADKPVNRICKGMNPRCEPLPAAAARPPLGRWPLSIPRQPYRRSPLAALGAHQHKGIHRQQQHRGKHPQAAHSKCGVYINVAAVLWERKRQRLSHVPQLER
jgi:hypothetical protein